MPRKSIEALVIGLGLCAAPALGQTAAQQPALSAAQAIQLFEEAGFALKDGRPVNRCGTPSNPRVAFIDLNGDRRAEAHVADVDPRCYGKPGAYFAILEQEADGRWKRLIAEDGIVGFQRERSIGWNNLSLEPANSACPGLRRFNGTDYGAPTACGTFANLAAAPASQAQAPAQAAPRINGPLSQEKLFDWSGEQLPEARDLPETERNALFRAADIQPIGGGKWSGCPDDPSGHSEAEVSMVRDLNGDDRPEALILDGGTFCYGHAGVGSTVLTKTATGSWKVLYTNQGFVNFLVSRGTDGFPDIEAGLPGFCFPYFRWNGQEYELIARLSDEGKTCEPF
jgi:hypothetical protein